MRPWWLGAAAPAHVSQLGRSHPRSGGMMQRPRIFALLCPPRRPHAHPTSHCKPLNHSHGETFVSRLRSNSIILAPGTTRLLSAPQACAFSRLAARSLCAPASEPRALFCLVFSRGYASSKKKKMPPKKAQPEQKVLLGRPGNNLKSGIVCRQPSSQRVEYAKFLP